MSEFVRLVCSIKGYDGRVLSLGWSPDRRRLIASCDDAALRRWDIDRDAKAVPTRYEAIPFPAQHLSRKPITDIDWSSDGKQLACACEDGSLIRCDPWFDLEEPKSEVSRAKLNCVAWAPRGHLLATGGDDQLLHVLDFREGERNQREHQKGLGHRSGIRRLLWSGDTTTIFTATDAGVIGIWTGGVDNQLRAFLQDPKAKRGLSHDGRISDLAYSQASGQLVSTSHDRTAKVWDVESRRLIQRLELRAPALGACFSPGGDVLIVRTRERLAFFRSDRMEEIESLPHPAPHGTGYLASNERSDDIRKGLIATENELSHCIDVWEVDFGGLLKRANASRRTYANARVVICGASDSGKTSLVSALASQPAGRADVAGHRGVYVVRLPEASNEDGTSDVREIALWDFPRDLYEIAVPIYAKAGCVAVSAVDAALLIIQTESLDPAGISRHPHGLGSREKRIIAVTKADLVRKDALASAVAALSSRHTNVHVTSAETGEGIQQLLEAVADSIQWAHQSTLPSIDDFAELESFIEEQRSAGNLLASERSLYTGFLRWAGRVESPNSHTEFSTGIELFENRGDAYRFRLGSQILLEPQYISAYLSGLRAAAARDSQGMGRIPSVEAHLGRGEQMMMAKESRISEDFERPLLSAILEELQDRQLILPVAADGISYIVFPTQPTRVMDEPPAKEKIAATASFDGEGGEIYSSLVVRSLRLPFSKKQADLYRNAAVFKTKNDATCGVLFRPGSGEQRAELSVFFDSAADKNTREDFLDFVRTHVAERASATLGWNVAQSTWEAGISAGLRVFFSYDDADLPNVLEISSELTRRGIMPWLQESEIQPGDDPKKRIDAIANHRVAIVAVNGATLSPKLQADCALFKRYRCRIIPVILPGTRADLDVPSALKDYVPVDFRLMGQRQYERLIDGIKAGSTAGTGAPAESAYTPYEFILVLGPSTRPPTLSVEESLALLQHASQDPGLTIKDSRSGSVYLFTGAEEGYRRLGTLWISGKLSELLGRPVHKLYSGGADLASSGALSFELDRMAQQACTMFVSYSRKDFRLLETFRSHLMPLQRQGLIRTWHDHDIYAGEDWQGQIDENLAAADIVLFLVSPDFLASEYCYGVELKHALERHRRHEAHVIPVIVRQADWKPVLGEFQALPLDAKREIKPIVRWDDRDSAWLSVIQGIKRTAESIISSRNG